MKKLVFILVIFFGFLYPTATFADMISNSAKYIDHCFKFSNIDDYPNYTFFAFPLWINSEHTLINKDTCFGGGYKFSTPKLYAIKNTNFKKEDLKDEELFFRYNTNIISSTLSLNEIDVVQYNSPLEEIIDILEITELSDKKFEIKNVKVIYKYGNGTEEEKYYEIQGERPEPSKKPIFPPFFFISLILTILFEFFVYYLFIRQNSRNLFLFSIAINSTTLPVASVIYWKLLEKFHRGASISFLFIELGVFVIEAVLLKKVLKFKKGILISFVANFVTMIIGSMYFTYLMSF